MSEITAKPEPPWDAEFVQGILAKVDPPTAHRPPEKRTTTRIWDMPGFVAGCRVTTTFGALPIEVIRVHDPLRTVTGATRRVRRINKITLSRDLLAQHPEAQPIRIKSGAFSRGLPQRDLIVSPGQIFELLGGGFKRPRLAAANIHGRPDITRVPALQVTYHVFEFDEPDTAFVEGTPVFVPVASKD